AHAAADHHVFTNEFDGARGGGDNRLKVSAVGQDGVEITSHQVGHGLVGGGKGHDGVARSEVLFGIGGLDGAALHADAGVRESRGIDTRASGGHELGRIRREVVL